ncbi:HNH endonuclease signature motif containing protein [Corynebacterium halotolerans]|uniref:HNH endonuclease signature motif containing protein n=1 Tax=Corynebacterium halotolerans TaxID=225326 RepID=UPI003CF6FE1D
MMEAEQGPFYTVNDPGRDTAVHGNRINRLTFEFWDGIQLDDDDDADLSLARIAADVGCTEYWAESTLDAVANLRHLPRLRAVQLQLHHLDIYRLRMINQALLKADEELFPEIDELLAEYLTPSRRHQELPTAHAIGAKIKAILDELDEEIATQQKSSRDNPEANTRIHEDGSGEINARYSAEIIQEVEQLIRRRAEEKGVNRADALLDLLRGRAEVKIVLNVYQAADIPGSPMWVEGVGWVDSRVAECIREQVTHVRDLSKYRKAESKSYQASPGLRAYLVGRDGVCRFPGCKVPATRCQVEHCLEYDKGGATSATNCMMLCQHHHNMKTDGRFTYELDPETAEATFIFLDGTVVSTVPEGPISPAGARWVQKVGKRRGQRRKRARAEAKRQKVREDAARDRAGEQLQRRTGEGPCNTARGGTDRGDGENDRAEPGEKRWEDDPPPF